MERRRGSRDNDVEAVDVGQTILAAAAFQAASIPRGSRCGADALVCAGPPGPASKDRVMKKPDVHKRILDVGIIPVIRAASPDLALEVSRAICRGGIPIIEMTLTVPGAIDLIGELSRSMPDVLIGAGTVLDACAAQRSIDAGAQFIVSPGLDDETVKSTTGQNVLMVAGCLTATEAMAAWKRGCDFVKIFPCASVGGPAYIKALSTVLPHIPMIPTGGVNLSNAAAFLCAGAAAIGVGSELTSAPSITETAQKFLAAVDAAREECQTQVMSTRVKP
jgi:2-dehydro-3-deoxyphosphogluconate aldolase/(4S)-4-hydroxy-2-oxoglutarate aldolase